MREITMSFLKNQFHSLPEVRENRARGKAYFMIHKLTLRWFDYGEFYSEIKISIPFKSNYSDVEGCWTTDAGRPVMM